MTGSEALQALLGGLSVGATYALIALGFTLVRRLTGVLNLAHGDLVLGSVFVAVLLVIGVTPVAAGLGGPRSVLFGLIVVVAGSALSVAVYWAAIRPFLSTAGHAEIADGTGWLAGGLAAGLLIRDGLGLRLGAPSYSVPDPLHLARLSRSGVLHLPGGTVLPVRTIGVLVAALVIAVLTERFLVVSRIGKAMQAVSERPTAAVLLGLPVNRLMVAAFAVSGALAGAAGLLVAPDRAVGLDDSVLLGLTGVGAAAIFGFVSLRGAVLGGLLLGVVQSFVQATPQLGPRFAELTPLVVLILAMALRPAQNASGEPAES